MTDPDKSELLNAILTYAYQKLDDLRMVRDDVQPLTWADAEYFWNAWLTDEGRETLYPKWEDRFRIGFVLSGRTINPEIPAPEDPR